MPPAPGPERPIRVIAFDPSIRCTGYAVLEETGSPTHPTFGRFVEAGTIKPKGTGVAERLLDLGNSVSQLLEESQPQAQVVVVEMPADQAIPEGKRRFKGSALSIPVYGAAVGVVLLAARYGAPSAELMDPSSTDWTGGDVPSSRDDEHKVARVRYAETLWRLKAGALGSKTDAGNVADALFLARWGLFRVGGGGGGGVAEVIGRVPRKAHA